MKQHRCLLRIQKPQNLAVANVENERMKGRELIANEQCSGTGEQDI
jgi:hypothetical protein